MAFGRFDVDPGLLSLTPDQVMEYSAAAARHYSPDYDYHGLNHALETASGTEVIAEKLESRGLTIAKGALAVAAAWHDAGYHENHIAKGFKTKEEYSAALLEKYLEDKPVGEWERTMMSRSIIATWAGHTALRTPYELILHRSDIANIGGPTDEFINHSINLWHETTYVTGKPLSWQQYTSGAAKFIEMTVDEHDRESLRHFIDTSDTTIDVNKMVFRTQAYRNLAALDELEMLG